MWNGILDSVRWRGRSPAALGRVGVICLALAQPVAAATITVGRYDSHSGADGLCSLRDAITSANENAAPYGDCVPGSGADTIVLTDHVTLTLVDNSGTLGDAMYGDTGLPIVTSEITVEGDNRTILRQPGVPPFRFFIVTGPSGKLTVKGVSLANGAGVAGGAILNFGTLAVVDSRLSDNHAISDGGAIMNMGLRKLLLRRSTLDGNTSDQDGGGIYNLGAAEIFDSLLWDNSAAANGGGIRNTHGSLTMVRTELSDNTAWSGGGLSIYDFDEANLVTVIESTFDGNSAQQGGGIFSVGSARVRILDTTLSSNRAQTGGGIWIKRLTELDANLAIDRSSLWGNDAASGGGLEILSGQVSITNSTLSGNQAESGTGGAINNLEGDVTLAFSTVMGCGAASGAAGIHNQAGTVTVASSILAGSTGGTNCSGTIVDGFNNFDDDHSCPWPGVITLVDPNLADNGGPTLTHALLDGSSAAHQTLLCQEGLGHYTDQRGAFRDLLCDSGAFEYPAGHTDDRYELSGIDGTDDNCPGHQIQYGQTEHHLLLDEDWVWFDVQVGATYVIETSNLHGLPPADTWLDLRRGCTTHLASDDNSGDGNASKITYVATHDDVVAGGLDVRVREVVAYDGDIGYDLEVDCVLNCPACTASGFNVFSLFDETVLGYRLVEACQAISVVRTSVTRGGLLMLRVGEKAAFFDGFEVEGELEVVIDPTLRVP